MPDYVPIHQFPMDYEYSTILFTEEYCHDLSQLEMETIMTVHWEGESPYVIYNYEIIDKLRELDICHIPDVRLTPGMTFTVGEFMFMVMAEIWLEDRIIAERISPPMK